MTSEQILQADMLDILFDGRNKKYGAYQLRIHKDQDHAKALFVGILITLAIFGYSFYKDLYSIEIVENEIRGPIEITPIKINDLEVIKEPIIPQTRIPEAKSIKGLFPYVIKENATETNEILNSEFTGNNEGHLTKGSVTGSGPTIDFGTDPDPGLFKDARPAYMPEVKEDKEFFTVVEQQPEFPGGESAMYKWISQNLIYPKEAVNNGLMGKVIVQFIVEKDGSITAVSVIRDAVGAGAGLEAKRIIEKMPDWKPGRQNGKNVRVQFTIPISFNLE